jgi:RNA-directed DNA polymerase
MFYTDALWGEWCSKIENSFVIKGYEHLDHRFDFPQRKEEIRKIVADPANVAEHAFLPLIKILIKTPRFRWQENEKEYGHETKTRPISFASHFDTYIYAFYSFVLTKKYQEYIHKHGFQECVLAYRSDLEGKCNIQFAKEVFDHVKANGECTAIALDIKGYFDHIDHHILKEKWCSILGVNTLPNDHYNLFRSLTKYAYINKTTILKHFGVKPKKFKKKPFTLLDHMQGIGVGFNKKFEILREYKLLVQNNTHDILANGRKRFYGIPQGSSISALLSNIYLIDYDKMMYEKAQKEGFLYRRYCDDILLLCDTKRVLELQKFAIEEIKKYHLTIQDKKVELIEFCENSKGVIRAFNLKKIMHELPSQLNKSNEQRFYKNLQYLGFEFNGKDILIRPGSLSRYFRKMKGRIIKTVCMAYSEQERGEKIFKQQLFHRYTHLGKRNFLHYAYNASKDYYKNSENVRKDGMNSPAIKRQLSRHFDILLYHLNKKNESRAMLKVYKGKLKKFKVV